MQKTKQNNQNHKKENQPQQQQKTPAIVLGVDSAEEKYEVKRKICLLLKI